jgi:hypothetical protein
MKMSKMNTEKKVIDRKSSLARLRTLSTQTLQEVAGGTGHLTYTLRDAVITGYQD